MPTNLGRRTPLSRLLRGPEVGAADSESTRTPHRRPPADDRAATVTASEMFAVIQRSNHATAFAGWAVTTCATGLIIEAGTIRSASHSPYGPLLLSAVLPLTGAAVYVVALLVRAGRVAAAAQEELFDLVAATAPGRAGFAATVWRRLRELTVAARHRERLSRRALIWAYLTGAGFLAWSAAIMVVA